MSADPSRAFATAVVLAVAGGLLLAGGGVGDWVVTETTRRVAGLSVNEVAATPGSRLAPAAVPLGLGLVLAGVVLAAVRGRLRRAVGALVGVGGLAGLVLVGAGLADAVTLPGRLAAAPGLAALGAGLCVGAGAAALRGPVAPAPRRACYAVERDEAAEDDEWRLASDAEGDAGAEDDRWGPASDAEGDEGTEDHPWRLAGDKAGRGAPGRQQSPR